MLHLLTQVAVCRNLEGRMLRDRNPSQKDRRCTIPLTRGTRGGRFIATEGGRQGRGDSVSRGQSFSLGR